MIINTAVGFYQEYRGEKTMEALKNMSSPTARVMREHDVDFVPTKDVVPGDIVYLEEGVGCRGPAGHFVIRPVRLTLPGLSENPHFIGHLPS